MKGFVFPVVITAIIVLVVGRALTFFNIGWRNEFVIRWWSAFAIGWPIAASTAYLAMPFARSLTQRIVAAVDPRRFRSEGSGLGQHFDRLYFYGEDRPLHVSVGPDESRAITAMLPSASGRRVPRQIKVDWLRNRIRSAALSAEVTDG
jgi:hypothetical protein